MVRDQLYAFADVAVRAFCELRTHDRRAGRGAFDHALTWLAPEDAEDAEERAAIAQFDGGRNRAEAERRALDSVIGKRRRVWKEP
ncbi:MAG TPA: hypothetical protein VEC57_20010 [Candidatus Limnocylindrales bacterium]|nr:hypothetical protein [Candidatus Limnocylindrales bacterium]